MKKVQESPWLKGAAVIVLLASALLSGLFGSFVLRGLPYQIAGSWQYTDSFYRLLQERQAAAAALVADSLAVGQLPLGDYTNEEQWSAGVALWESQGRTAAIWPEDSPTYVETRQYEQEIARLSALLDPEQTWFRFQVRTDDGSFTLGGNLAPGESIEDAVDTVHYASFNMGEYWVEDSSFSWSGADETTSESNTDPAVQPIGLMIECGVSRDLEDAVAQKRDITLRDEFYSLLVDYNMERANFSSHVTGFCLFLALAAVCVICILWTAGHKRGTPGIVLTWQEKIFFDLYALVMSAACVGLAAAAFQSADYLLRIYENGMGDTLDQVSFRLYTALFAGAAAGFAAAVTLILRTLAVRLKAGAFVRTCALCLCVRWFWGILSRVLWGLPLVWRWVVLFAVYLLANLYLSQQLYWYNDSLIFLFYLVLNGAVLLAVCWWALCFRRLRDGGRTIAAGNYSHRIDTARMPHDLKDCGESLNNISAGLSAAVDERMKSERFKAELITNVSHDLKTPLTSIINYVNLLKSTQQTDAKAVEYIEVLDRKSQRLKKLTEDLVEASKASTGVLSVNREKISMGQLIDQALGEWTEKLEERKLTVVPTLPEGETWVYADGRHLWRVIDNLLSNCAKYAMEGTRVYLDLYRGKGQVQLSVKNISREPLNVPPERLMERFVRGDESRTTEGSGLGLSIARSLTELQGGEFQLTVDGDLFKASVTLPQAS